MAALVNYNVKKAQMQVSCDRIMEIEAILSYHAATIEKICSVKMHSVYSVCIHF